MSELKDIHKLLNPDNNAKISSLLYLQYYNAQNAYGNYQQSKFNFCQSIYTNSYNKPQNCYIIIRNKKVDTFNINQSNIDTTQYQRIFNDKGKINSSKTFNVKFDNNYSPNPYLTEYKSIYIDIGRFSSISKYIHDLASSHKGYKLLYKSFCKLFKKREITFQDLINITNGDEESEEYVFNLIYHIIMVYFKSCSNQSLKHKKSLYENIFFNSYDYWNTIKPLYESKKFIFNRGKSFNCLNLFNDDDNDENILTDGVINKAFIKNNTSFNEYMYAFLVKKQYKKIVERVNELYKRQTNNTGIDYDYDDNGNIINNDTDNEIDVNINTKNYVIKNINEYLMELFEKTLHKYYDYKVDGTSDKSIQNVIHNIVLYNNNKTVELSINIPVVNCIKIEYGNLSNILIPGEKELPITYILRNVIKYNKEHIAGYRLLTNPINQCQTNIITESYMINKLLKLSKLQRIGIFDLNIMVHLTYYTKLINTLNQYYRSKRPDLYSIIPNNKLLNIIINVNTNGNDGNDRNDVNNVNGENDNKTLYYNFYVSNKYIKKYLINSSLTDINTNSQTIKKFKDLVSNILTYTEIIDPTEIFINPHTGDALKLTINDYSYEKANWCSKPYQPWSNTFGSDEYKFDKQIPDRLKNILDNHTLQLFDYQKENVLWMNDMENKVDNNDLYINNYLYRFIMDTNYYTEESNDHTGYPYDRNNIFKLIPFIHGNYYKITITKYSDDNFIKEGQLIKISLVFEQQYYKGNYIGSTGVKIPFEKFIYLNDNDYNTLMGEGPINTTTLYKLFEYLGYSQKMYLRGGFLCDDVGLGKTASTVTHCLHKLSSDNENAIPYTENTIITYDPIAYDFTDGNYYNENKHWMYNNLVIVPTRLIKQWKFEIEKYSANQEYKPTIATFSSITDIKKFDKQNKQLLKKEKQIKRPDFIIMSSNLFNNNNYFKYITEMHTKYITEQKRGNSQYNEITDYKYDAGYYFDIFKIWWNRIIIDEIHEVVKNDASVYFSQNTKKADRQKAFVVTMLVNSNYKWGLSATPIESMKRNLSAYLFWQNDLLKVFNNHLYTQYLDFTPIYERNPMMEQFKYKYNIVKYTLRYYITKNDNKIKNMINFLDIDNYPEFDKNKHSKDSLNKLISELRRFDNKFILSVPFVDYFQESEITQSTDLNRLKLDEKLLSGICTKGHLLCNVNFNIFNTICNPWFSDKNFYELSTTFSKVTKSLVSKEIGIPIFTEEIKYINLTTVERGIYDGIKHELGYANGVDYRQNANSYYRRNLKRLYQVCTNILINDYIMSEINKPNEILTLEELNENMKKATKAKLTIAISDKEFCDNFLSKYDKIIKFMKYCIMHLKKKYSKYFTNTPLNNNNSRVINKYISNFTSSIKRMEQNGFTDYTRYINSWDYGAFEEYLLLDLEFKKFMETITNDLPLDNWEIKDNMLDIPNDDVLSIFNPLINGIKESFDNIIRAFIHNLMIVDKGSVVLYSILLNKYTNMNSSLERNKSKSSKLEMDIKAYQNQIKLFKSDDFIKEKTDEPCVICLGDYEDDMEVVIAPCRHIVCGDCFGMLSRDKVYPCPECRQPVDKKKVNITTYDKIINSDGNNGEGEGDDNEISENDNAGAEEVETPDWEEQCLNKYGSKMLNLIKVLNDLFSEDKKEENNRVIIFSQYDNMLKLIGQTLKEFNIKHCYIKGNVHSINKNIDLFKRDDSIRVIMLSSENCNSGCNLTEANHIIMIDVLNADKAKTLDIEAQAIGRSVRLGQKRPVKLIRFITKNTIEEDTFLENRYDIKDIQ
jgi:hypothetical protein